MNRKKPPNSKIYKKTLRNIEFVYYKFGLNLWDNKPLEDPKYKEKMPPYLAHVCLVAIKIVETKYKENKFTMAKGYKNIL